MIDGLIAGKLSGSAQSRTAQNGKTFVTCRLRAADADGEAQYVIVVGFDDIVKNALLALGDGDSVSASGAVAVGTYEARDGATRVSIKLVASAVLTPYHAKRKREAVMQASGTMYSMSPASGASKQRGQREAAAAVVGDAMPDDDVAL